MVRLSNSMGQNVEIGPVAVSAVGGDHACGRGDGGVEVDVVGERDLDDAVHAVGRRAPDSLDGRRVVQRDADARRRDRRRARSVPCRTVPMTVAPPSRELRRQSADPPSTPWTRTVEPSTGRRRRPRGGR